MSILEALGLPGGFGQTLLLLFLVLTVAPYMAERDFGVLKVPKFSHRTRRKLTVLGPILLFLAVALHAPILDNEDRPGETNNRSVAPVPVQGTMNSASPTTNQKRLSDLEQYVALLGDLEEPQGRDIERFTDVLTAGAGENPFAESCLVEAFRHVVEVLQETHSAEGALDVARRHLESMDELLIEKSLSYSGYLDHVLNCSALCQPLFVQLTDCHVLAVSKLDREIILFEMNSRTIPDRFKSVVNRITERLLQQPERKLLLIGRSSRMGRLAHSRDLARSRTREVSRDLVQKGVARSRISAIWLGVEPPIIDEDVAIAYGMRALYSEVGQEALNQSVVLVVY